ncbi:putative peptidoglycan glycosyltransferase FtsW [Psychrilyobacter sp.]|uniref:FtsW/RodA/SpoVE family cell cycle protein n=1 Tax=Psychrilyobacter sp. TaxID=2586924 RepID=UPI003015D721
MKIKNQSLYGQNFEIEEKIGKRSIDSFIKVRGWILIIVTLGLAIFSLLNIASASFYTSMRIYKTEYFFVKRQFLFLLAGIIPLFMGLGIDYKWYEKKRTIKLIVILVLLLFGVIAIGTAFGIDFLVPVRNGSRRWIDFKIVKLQPSELLKIAYIILIAKGLHACRQKKYKNMDIVYTISPIVLFFVLSVFFQRDLGTALHYIAISFVMIFFSDIELKHIFKFFAIIVVIGITYGSYAYFIGDDSSYRNRRIKAYVKGVIYNEYDNRDGYQIKQSLIAVGNGGFFGKGLGNGTQKYSYLPEIHTDFIMASIGEEWGFVGVSIMFLAYIIILQIGAVIAKSARDYFGKYLAIGITGYLFSQIIMNVYVVTGLMPVTGIPLPLMSYGGTSLWTTLFSIGVLYNINKHSLKGGAKGADQKKRSSK